MKESAGMRRTASGNVIVGALPTRPSYSKSEAKAIEKSRAANKKLKANVKRRVKKQSR